MAAKETPLQTVKRAHGSKDKLIEQLISDLRAAGEEAEDLDERLRTQSNSKLLRLAGVATAVKNEFGGKDGLVKAVAEAQGKGKDGDYVGKLQGYPLPRLLDMARAARRA